MRNIYFDTCGKLVEIFTNHCSLTGEQYEWISAEFIYLEADIMEEEPISEIEARIEKMKVVFDFLLKTNAITLGEHFEMIEFMKAMLDSVVCEAKA